MAEQTLVGGRCTLRAYREGDLQTLHALLNDFDVSRWMTARIVYPYTEAAAREWIARASIENPIDNFAIEVDGTHVGGIGIGPESGETLGGAEFGYWLGRRYWGRGIATEAVRLAADYAFRVRGLRWLQAHVFIPNAASAHVLEKCGFSREVVLREYYVDRSGGVVDGLLYVRLASDIA